KGAVSVRLLKLYEGFLNRAGQTAGSSSTEKPVACRSWGSKAANGETPTRVSMNLAVTGFRPHFSDLKRAVPGLERFRNLSTTMTIASQVPSMMSTKNVGCAEVVELSVDALPGGACSVQRYE